MSKIDIKHITNESLKKVRKDITKNGTEIECPNCKGKIKVMPGESICPKCGKTLDVRLKF